MSLHTTTDAILRAAPGAWACCIMGFDGLTVEARESPQCPATALTWVTEMSAALAALRRAGQKSAAAEVGAWDDLVLSSGLCHLVVSALGDAYFVALVVGPQGLSGQGRHVLRQHRPALMVTLFPPSGPPDGAGRETGAQR